MCVGRAGLHRGSAGAAGRGQWQARHAAEGATGLLRPGHDGEGSGKYLFTHFVYKLLTLTCLLITCGSGTYIYNNDSK